MTFTKKILVIILVLISTVYSQNKFRVMTYNILNYPSKISDIRNPHFKKILDDVQPDILVVQEIETIAGVTKFHEQVLNERYGAGGFINGNDTDNGLFYRNDRFNFLSNIPIRTVLRDISQFTLEHIATKDTLLIFSVHLKASSGATQRERRLQEIIKLREVTDNLPIGSKYMIVGDFNIYYSNEPAFQKLIDKTNTGYCLDPINKLGNWHNGSIFSGIHTQSTRTGNLSDGGSSGGLDDRFDMILISQAIKDSGSVTYIPNSYKAYGNDGSHFNKNINAQPNNAVTSEIAEALYRASDHLPVYADFEIQAVVGIKDEVKIISQFKLHQNYPNPFNPTTTIKYTIPNVASDFSSRVTIKVYNTLGKEIQTLVNRKQEPGEHSVNFNAKNLSAGVYFYKFQVDGFVQSKKMLLIK
ncbi:MAG: T9SS type A sorting domain-containing protein [Melioribacteraceae bacterium]